MKDICKVLLFFLSIFFVVNLDFVINKNNYKIAEKVCAENNNLIEQEISVCVNYDNHFCKEYTLKKINICNNIIKYNSLILNKEKENEDKRNKKSTRLS